MKPLTLRNTKKVIKKGEPSFQEFQSTLTSPFPLDTLKVAYGYVHDIVYLGDWTILETCDLQSQVCALLKLPGHQEYRHNILVDGLLKYFENKGALQASNGWYLEPIRKIVWRVLAACQPQLVDQYGGIGERVFETTFAFTETGANFDYDDFVVEVTANCAPWELEQSTIMRIIDAVYDFMCEKGFWG